jgi:putative transposase
MKRSKDLKHNAAPTETVVETAERPAFPQALLDHVMANCKQPSDLIGENGMLKQLIKASFEATLNAEINQRLGHTRHGKVGTDTDSDGWNRW